MSRYSDAEFLDSLGNPRVMTSLAELDRTPPAHVVACYRDPELWTATPITIEWLLDLTLAQIWHFRAVCDWATELVYDLIRRPLYYNAVRWQAEDPDDAVQYTLCRAFLKAPALTSRGENVCLEAWMKTVERNFIMDRHRCRARLLVDEPPDDLISIPDEGPSPEAATATVQLRQMLHDCLATLQEQDRKLIHLKHFEELPYENTAVILGGNRVALATRFNRAKKKLRECLDHKLAERRSGRQEGAKE